MLSRRLGRLLSQLRPILGVSCLAKGADQLFSAILIQHGIDLKVVVPCRQYEKAFDDPVALSDYLFFVEHASSVETLDFELPCASAFLAAGKSVVNQVDLMIALWDGRPATGLGGTADIVAYAREVQKKVLVVWPSDYTQPLPGTSL